LAVLSGVVLETIHRTVTHALSHFETVNKDVERRRRSRLLPAARPTAVARGSVALLRYYYRAA
jgi:hypothetical protein